MQIFYLSEKYMIALFFILWPIFQFGAAFICHTISDEHFHHDRFIYGIRNWEKSGKVYEQILKVHKWKKFLPDGASIGKKGFRKKHMDSFSKPNLEKYLMESCRAELTHWLAILPFWIFGLFSPARVVGYMFIYALVVNFPCIVAQRYNRPRMARLLSKIDKRVYTNQNQKRGVV